MEGFVPGGIRTHNLRLRRPTLYPIELPRHADEVLRCRVVTERCGTTFSGGESARTVADFQVSAWSVAWADRGLRVKLPVIPDFLS